MVQNKMCCFTKLSLFSIICFIFIATTTSSRYRENDSDSIDDHERHVRRPKCGPNQQYKCGSACQVECERLGQICKNETRACNRGCFCNKGYARDHRKECILIKKCPNLPLKNCDNPHEHYECGSACQTTCENYGQICPKVNVKCNEECYCDFGYARDEHGICIPVWQCPQFNGPKECRKRNEHYDIGQVCDKHCGALNKPCNTHSSVSGCFCNEGYARNVKGECIPIKSCPIERCNCQHHHHKHHHHKHHSSAEYSGSPSFEDWK